MKKKTENEAKSLWQELRSWGWPNFFKTLGPKAMLVSDRDLISHLEGVVKLRCKTATPEDISSDKSSKQLLTNIHTVFVFSRNDEYRIVLRLRAQFPGKRIFSAQYDLGPSSHERPKSPPTHMLEPTPVAYKQPVILLATPGSDSDYLAALMTQAGLPCPVEYFGKPIVGISKSASHFMPARYFHGVQKTLGDTQADFSVLLHTDVVAALVSNTRLSAERLKKWLHTSGAKIIYLRREDKLFQAGLSALLQHRPFRSIWSILPNQRKLFPGYQQANFLEGMQALGQINREEQLVEDLLSRHTNTITLSTEEFTSDPMQQLGRIAEFLDGKMDPAISIQPGGYQEEYAAFPDLFDRIVEFRRQYIDRLGLHAAPKTDSIAAP